MEHSLMIHYDWLMPVFAFLIAFCAVWWIHPHMVYLALSKNIVDNPDARKLQREPVPVLGGMAVFAGILLALVALSPFYGIETLVIVISVMTFMLFMGTFDDIRPVSPFIRMALQIVCMLLLVYAGGYCIDSFHGLWGLRHIPSLLAVPMTVFITVGIINAINLMDGVNGLSSGYCMMTSVLFGIFFYVTDNMPMTVLAAACVGALIPFFMHNVFGQSSRMFIGDGGTLLMGTVMSVFVMEVLDTTRSSFYFTRGGIGLIPFAMAVLSIPVFDTLRVMTFRMMKGHSPFLPDKTHLHHMFIGLGYSHAGTTLSVLLLNLLVMLAWGASYLCGTSIDVQLYVVLVMGFLCTFGLYSYVEHTSRRGLVNYNLRKLAVLSHIERKGIFLRLQRWLDKV